MSERKEQLERLLAAQPDGLARREFLTRMGAALAFAGIGACTRAPREEIVPYVVQPPEVTLGRAKHYASVLVLDGYATGVLVETHEGRPTKIEGNPDHPASLGATSAIDQAAVLSLYDPVRARGVKERGEISTWEQLAGTLKSVNRGLWFLLEPTSSPSTIALIETIRARYPDCRIVYHAPASPRNEWAGSKLAFGKVLEPRHDFYEANVVVSLDGDFLMHGPAHLRAAREFAKARDSRRLYAVGPLLGVTAAHADHRRTMRAADVPSFAAALLRELESAETNDRFLRALARDLRANKGNAIVLAGASQPPVVHALAMRMNEILWKNGFAVRYAPSAIHEAGTDAHDVEALRAALAAGQVECLVMAGVNPVVTVPGLAVEKAKTSVCLSLYETATTRASTFSVAEAHPLEAWTDARAFDGTISVGQPTIAPMHDGRTVLDLLSLFVDSTKNSHDLVRARFADDRAWRTALKRGVVAGSGIAPIDTKTQKVEAPAAAPLGLELVRPLDPHLHDGRFSQSAWLLELPAPITKLTWTNAATIAPALATKSGIVDGDEIEIRAGSARVKVAVVVVDGQADDSIVLTLGWGGKHGVDAYPLDGGPVSIVKTGNRRTLARSQLELSLESEERAKAVLHGKPAPKRLSLYDPKKPSAPKQWGMAIDLAQCTGCNACVVACQAENNVPVVGEEEVRKGRLMHWLRIDTYREKDEVAAQPMLCQHCEKAPCEYVCPVGATVHGDEGLNEMVYNRCVGTRFCSNNCPYKVRRFNWFDYHQDEPVVAQLVHNPDVTVRERGVMEKCSFCVQRIREHHLQKGEGEPVTACQQVCPSSAIVFGDVANPDSEVSEQHRSPRAFAALSELGTEPRVRYLGRTRNRNPEIDS